jgi:hypothetical protein
MATLRATLRKAALSDHPCGPQRLYGTIWAIMGYNGRQWNRFCRANRAAAIAH